MIYTLIHTPHGVGVYADDTERKPWTTFQHGRGKICGECGKTITFGYVRSSMTEDDLYVCCEHIRWEGLPPLPVNQEEE